MGLHTTMQQRLSDLRGDVLEKIDYESIINWRFHFKVDQGMMLLKYRLHN